MGIAKKCGKQVLLVDLIFLLPECFAFLFKKTVGYFDVQGT
jgi:hypothetical protein